MKTLLILLFLGVLTLSTNASHIIGGEITYEHIDTKKYKVTLKIYRDCRGIALIGAGWLTIRCSNGGSTNNVTLSLESIKDITNNADSSCGLVNTSASGKGAEEHTYSGVIDFSKAPLSSLASCSGDIVISSSINARNGAITTGPSGNFYVEARLNLNKATANTSPVFDFEPTVKLCCNQPTYLSWSCTELDGDSLSYAWTHPLRAYGSNVTYSAGYTYNKPITVYDPTNGGPAIPTSNPPIGLYLNSKTGEVVLTPTDCDEGTVAKITVYEWRKNTSGVMENIGEVSRDIQINTSSCGGNLTPVTTSNLDQTHTFTSCLNNIETIISTKDTKDYLSAAQDTVSILMAGQTISGVSVEVLNKDSIFPKLRVQVTNEYLFSKNFESHILNIPFELRDNNVPNGRTQLVLKMNLVNTDDPYSHLNGSVISDTNSNCTKDASEDTLSWVREVAIIDSAKTYYLNTNADGSFSTCAPVDSLTLRLVPSPWFESDCGDSTFQAKLDSTYDITLYSKLKDGIGGYVIDNGKPNCTINAINTPRVGQLLKLTPGNIFASTDKDGFYLFPITTSGNYTVELIEDSTSVFRYNCVKSQNINYSGTGTANLDTFLTYNYINSSPILNLSSSRGTRIVRGGTGILRASVSNANEIDSISIYLKLDLNLNVLLNSANSSLGWTHMGGGLYKNTINNPGSNSDRYLVVEAPASKFARGDTVHIQAHIDSVPIDQNLKDNRKTAYLIVVGSYDPNIKTTEQDSLFTVDNRFLDYTITFQNTGNSPANRVVIKDTLPPELDLEKIQFIGASHSYYPIVNDREIWFVFEDINLPDSNSNQEGSIGSVTFRIPIYESIYRDTFVHNRAGIYFDFEEPILTPTATNLFKTPIIHETDKQSYCATDTLEVDFYTIFNPSIGNTFYLELTDSSGNHSSFHIIDSFSSTDTFGQFLIPLDTSWLPSKNYKLRISSSNFETKSFEQYYETVEIFSSENIILHTANDTICASTPVTLSTSWNGLSNTWYLNGDSVTNTRSYYKTDMEHLDMVWMKSTSVDGCTFRSDSIQFAVHNNLALTFIGDSFSCGLDRDLSFYSRTELIGNGSGTLSFIDYTFGDGTFQTKTDTSLVSHSYSAGNYTLTAVGHTDEGCSDSFSQAIFVGTTPSPKFILNKDTFCGAEELIAIDTSTLLYGSINSKIYKVNNAIVGSGNDTFRSSTLSSGAYSLILVSEDNFGCIDSFKSTFDVLDQPSANFSIVDSTLCLNELPLIATSTSTGHQNIEWQIDGQSRYTTDLKTDLPLGTNTLLLIAKNLSCIDSMSTEISVFDTADAKFNLDTEICQYNDINLVAENIKSFAQYDWLIDRIQLAGSNVNQKINTTGDLTIKLNTTTTDGCMDSMSNMVRVLPTGDTGFLAENVCEGEVTTISNTSKTQSALFTYIFGDGNEQRDQVFSDNVTHLYSSSGAYDLTQISTIGSCSDTLAKTVTIWDIPVASFIANNSPSTRSVVEIENTSSGGVDYQWFFGDDAFSNNTSPNFEYSYSAPGQYVIKLIATSLFGCKDSVEVPFNAIGNISFYVPTAFSPNEDNINDFYNIEPRHLISSLEMKVYNRWGELVTVSTKTTNILQPLPIGMYIYVLKIVDTTGKTHSFDGILHVLK